MVLAAFFVGRERMFFIEKDNWKENIPSSSRTDSPIVTEVSWFEYCRTIILVNSIPRLDFLQLSKRRRNDSDILPSHLPGQFRMTVACEQLY